MTQRASRPDRGYYIGGWDDRSHPFVWTRTAANILKKANRMKTSSPGHY
jgi:hypothetical protein